MHMLYVKTDRFFKSTPYYLNSAATEVRKTQQTATVILARPGNPSSLAPPAVSIPAASETKQFCSPELDSNTDFYSLLFGVNKLVQAINTL